MNIVDVTTSLNTSRQNVQEIPEQNLIVDPRYQRFKSDEHVKKIIDNFSIQLASVIIVNDRRDGTYAVLDGQHRLAAMRLLGYKTIPCLVSIGLTLAQEAKMFNVLNRMRRSANACDDFRSRECMGEFDAKDIRRIATECGVTLGTSVPKRGSRTSVTIAYSAINYIYKTWGPDILRQTLNFAVKAWPEDRDALTSAMLWGIGRFLKVYGGSINYSETIKKLGTVSPLKIQRDAYAYTPPTGARGAGCRSGGLSVARALAANYNYNRKEAFRLDEEELLKTAQKTYKG